MTSEITGLAAVVTGGASGIGASIVEVLTSAGAQVAVLDLNCSNVDNRLMECRVDVGDRRSVEDAIAAVGERFGRIDILVNNAGVGAQGDVAANDDSEWARVLSINVTGIARVTSASLPWLRESPSAAICNIASVAATVGLPQRALYSASKGAVLALTRAMATDHISDGIRVNAVSPGTADTPWIERLLFEASDPAAERGQLERRQPHGRLVSAKEVASAVLYLVGPNAGSTTGSIIEVDGGLSNLRPRNAS